MVQPRRCFFFFENVKHLGRSDDAKQKKKKRMALSAIERRALETRSPRPMVRFRFQYLIKIKANWFSLC